MKAIIWTVLPNIRKDALLTKQARLIDLFKPAKIWNNVIIICKQVILYVCVFMISQHSLIIFDHYKYQMIFFCFMNSSNSQETQTMMLPVL